MNQIITKSTSWNQKIKELLMDEKLSDVSFLVGDQKTKICAHIFILTLTSPVFNKMFNGDLKMDKTRPIEIPDISVVGFKNMLHYIYTNEIRFKLDELYETYLAGDKYLVDHMIDDMTKYVDKNVTKFDCCLLYDQLMMIHDKELFQVDEIKKMIITDSVKFFKSDHFTKISQNTLINLLNLPKLNMREIDLLKYCSKWVNANSIESDSSFNSLKSNKQKLFEPIKSLIRFGDLKARDIGEFKELDVLFETNEICSLFLHLLNFAKPLIIECLTARDTGYPIHCVLEYQSEEGYFIDKDRQYLSVNQEVNIKHIHTFLNLEYQDLELNIFDLQDQKLPIQKKVVDSRSNTRSIVFKNGFKILPKTTYLLEFQSKTVSNRKFRIGKSSKLRTDVEGMQIVFDLACPEKNVFSFNLIKQIDFFIP